MAVRIGDRKILLWLARANAIHPKGRARGQSPNSLIGGKGFRNAPKQTKSNPTRRLLTAADFPPNEQRLNLRCKAESPAIVRIVQRLDAVGITRQQKSVLLSVPQTECKHSAEIIHHCLAFFRIKMKQDLRVGLSVKLLPL